MSVIVNSYNLANNYNKQDIFTQSFYAYGNLISRTFKHLPDDGKLSELAKRLGVIAAPLIYPLLGACMIVAQGYYKLTRWYVSNLLEKATDKIAISLTELNKGKGPYELVALLSVQSQNSTLYADLITLQSDQFANGKLPFFLEKIQEQKQVVNEKLKDARFNIGQNIEVKWEGFLKNGKGDFSTMRGDCSCDYMLIAPYGGNRWGGGIFDNVEQVKSAFKERLQTLKVTQPHVSQHFAY